PRRSPPVRFATDKRPNSARSARRFQVLACWSGDQPWSVVRPLAQIPPQSHQSPVVRRRPGQIFPLAEGRGNYGFCLWTNPVQSLFRKEAGQRLRFAGGGSAPKVSVRNRSTDRRPPEIGLRRAIRILRYIEPFRAKACHSAQKRGGRLIIF